MPCTSVFDAQDEAWRAAVLPDDVRCRVAIEAGVPDGWWRYVGSARPRDRHDAVSARRRRARTCSGNFGFTSAAVVEAAESLLNTGEN